jgi:hypothetical protein
MPERRERPTVCGYRIIGEVACNDLPQPVSLIWGQCACDRDCTLVREARTDPQTLTCDVEGQQLAKARLGKAEAIRRFDAHDPKPTMCHLPIGRALTFRRRTSRSPRQLRNQPPLLLRVLNLEFFDGLLDGALSIGSVNVADQGRRRALDHGPVAQSGGLLWRHQQASQG